MPLGVALTMINGVLLFGLSMPGRSLFPTLRGSAKKLHSVYRSKNLVGIHQGRNLLRRCGSRAGLQLMLNARDYMRGPRTLARKGPAWKPRDLDPVQPNSAEHVRV